MDDKRKIEALLDVIAVYTDALNSAREAIVKDNKEKALFYCENGLMEGSFMFTFYERERGGLNDNDN